MDLNLFSIKVFLKVAETMSFTQAANELLLSQPAVSLQVQKIEQIFHTPLFIRKKTGRIALTEAGKCFMGHAEELLRLQRTVFRDMGRYSPALRREVRIGACCIAGEQLLPLGLRAFRETHSSAKLMLTITKCEEVIKGLLAGDLDVGVTGLEPKSRFLHKKQLMRVALVWFESGKTQPATGTTDLKGLQNNRIILREKGSGARAEFESFLARNKMDLQQFSVVSESESNEAIKNLVEDGYGVSLLPEFMVRKDIDLGTLAEIHLKEGNPIQTFYLTYRKQDPPSVMVKELITFLSQYPIGKSVAA